mgnify:CR=1 FL=1
MKHLLSSSAFLIVNKNLARKIGLKESIMLADLISKEEYFTEHKQIDNGWFFNTLANIEKDTTLTPFMQRKCLKTLKNHQIVRVKRVGLPAKNYFKINEQQLVKFIDNLTSTNLTPINKNKIIKINNISNRLNDFEEEVFNSEYLNEMCEDFFDYWSEPNKSNTKMKWELEKTFDIKRRLKTWEKNSKKWNKSSDSNKDKLSKNMDTMNNVLNKLNGYD